MQEWMQLAVAGLTLAIALGLARRRLGVTAPVALALVRALETLGLTAIFLAVNVALLFLGVLLLRPLIGFVSSYAAADEFLLILSLLQAIVFSHWLHAGPKGAP